MTRFVDARVPIVFAPAAEAGPEDAVVEAVADAVVEMPVADAGHVPGCACCVPRGALAEALGRLFLARARGDVRFFRRVVVVTDNPAAVAAALAADPFVSGRFRLA